MNILLPYSSITKRLNTNATLDEFQRFLSLCGPSVERVEKSGNDYVLDIEVTTNRIDMASVAGIVQEAHAILPVFGKKATIIEDLLSDYSFEQVHFEKNEMLTVQTDYALNPRLTAVVLDNVQVGPTPVDIRIFLENVGVRSINNVVDISNYLMFLFGQPVHMFDYDKIAGAHMKIRRSTAGEKLLLLDEKTYTLPGDDIVIEDGSGELIDLCGIMGGKISEVDEETKRIILFVPSYDKKHIRQTSMRTAARSVAASYYEKGIDTARVESTFVYGVNLLIEHAHAHVASDLIDLHDTQYQERSITVSNAYITEKIGEKVAQKFSVSILSSLGFGVKTEGDLMHVTVPFWRQFDVFEAHDIVEEVARIYGYHTVQEEISPFALIRDTKVREFEQSYKAEHDVKLYLRDSGFVEMYNYSMQSLPMLKEFMLDPKKHVKLLNPISEELVYMRQSIIPSLYKNMTDNTQFENLMLFEIAHMYIPRANDLPLEQKTIGMLLVGDLNSMKVHIQNILTVMHTEPYFKPNSLGFADSECIGIYCGTTHVGIAGRLLPVLEQKFGRQLIFAQINWNALIEQRTEEKTVLQKKPQYVIEDITYVYTHGFEWSTIVEKLSAAFSDIKRIEYRDQYKNNVTMRLYSISQNRISSLKKYIGYMQNELGVTVKVK